MFVGGSGLEGDAIAGNGWLFDSATGPATPACASAILRNLKNLYGHPFQKFLWTDWTTVAAQKL